MKMRLKIVVIILILIIVTICIYLYNSNYSYEEDNFVNLVDVKVEREISIDNNNQKEYININGYLFFVSLRDCEVSIQHIDNEDINKTIKLDKKHKYYSIRHLENKIYLFLDTDTIYEIDQSSLNYIKTVLEKEDNLYRKHIYLKDDKIITLNHSHNVRINNIDSKKIIMKKKVEWFRENFIYDNNIAVYGKGNNIHVYDLDDLTLKWSYEEDYNQHNSPEVLLYKDYILFQNYYDLIYLRADNGKVIKKVPFKTQRIEVIDDKLYGVTYKAYILVADACNGNIKNKYLYNTSGSKRYNNYVIYLDEVDNHLKKYDFNNNKIEWSVKFNVKALFGLKKYGDKYHILLSKKGKIHLIDANTGQEIWRYAKNAKSWSDVKYEIYKNKLIIADRSNTIKIFDLDKVTVIK